MSTGNQYTEVNFQEHSTNLIVGTNGAGKSTVLDALTFVLFNKPFRKINKSQLVNTTNEREAIVEISLVINSRDYIIRRGIKPNIFDIIQNGVELNKEADDRAMQRLLEESILKWGWGSEIISTLVEQDNNLGLNFKRIGMSEEIIPCSKTQEEMILPDNYKIYNKIRDSFLND